jgi:hypothetical protein
VTTYQEITRKVGDRWVAALKAAEDSIVELAASLEDVRGKVELPDVPRPEALSRLKALSERLPKPSEVVEANFELTNRLLTAQRDLTLRLLEVGGRAASHQPAANAAAKKTTKEA